MNLFQERIAILLILVLPHITKAKEILWSKNTESQLIQSMLFEAIRGKWYPTSNKNMPFDEFQLKHGKLYRDGSDETFTGWYAQFDELDEPRMLCCFADGKKDGFMYLWDGNGTRRFQGEYSKNLKNGEFIEWNIFAIPVSRKNYQKDKLHGYYQLWYDNGKIKLDAVFNSGKLLEARGWYPDGSPCPYSKVANGRGVILRYENNFQRKTNSERKQSVLRSVFKELPEFKK